LNFTFNTNSEFKRKWVVKKLIPFILLLIIILMPMGFSSCIAGVINGSGKIQTKTYEFVGFTRITINHAFKFDITRSDNYSISITADDNLFQFLSINQYNDTLVIDLDPTYTYLNTTETGKISLPALNSLSLSGASQANVGGFNSTHPAGFNLSGASVLAISDLESGDTTFDVSGAGRVSGKANLGNVKFTLSGAGNVTLEGAAPSESIEASGGSQIALSGFPVTSASVVLSGGSIANINVSGKLDVDISGGSQLDYTGEPGLGKVSVSGGATLNPQ
jgi:hypothetical protein